MDIEIGIGIIKDLLKPLNERFKDDVWQVINNRILEYQVEEYKRNALVKTLMYRQKPVRFYDVYHPLKIYSIQEKRWLRGKPENVTTLKEFFKNGNNKVTIIGSAGSGKSTFIKDIYLKCIDQKYKIPIKVELRNLNLFSSTLLDYIKEKIFGLNKLAESDKKTERLFLKGEFLVILDGFDEVAPNKKNDVLIQIEDLTRVYNENTYILTSRNYTSANQLSLFKNYEISGIPTSEVESFVRKQLKDSNEDLIINIMKSINENSDNIDREFLSNPLLLTLFILTFRVRSKLPKKRHLFYSKVIDTLSYEHDSLSKLNFIRTHESKLSVDDIEFVLRLLGFTTYFNDQPNFTKLEIFEVFNYVKSEFSYLFDNHNLLSDLLVGVCILVEEGGYYSFAHRSLQEYFAAKCIYSQEDILVKKDMYETILERLI